MVHVRGDGPSHGGGEERTLLKVRAEDMPSGGVGRGQPWVPAGDGSQDPFAAQTPCVSI